MMTNRTRSARPTLLGLLYLFLQTWSVFTTSLELTLSKIRDERKPLHRLAPLGNPERKHSLLFVLRGGEFLLKMERVFSFGVLPSKYSGSVAGLQFGLGFAKTIFWGKGFGKTSANFCCCILSARRRGLGRNPRGLLFVFLIANDAAPLNNCKSFSFCRSYVEWLD